MNKLTRRQALKTLLAAGGSIGVASFLPAQWMKPVVQSGVLPAHAQASGMASCAPFFDLKFLNYNDGDTYLCFDFVIDPDPWPTSYSVSKVSIVGTNDYEVNGPDCEEISIMPTFVGTICEYMSGTPTYVTATITFNYGETIACTPDQVTSTCAYTYKGYPVTAV